MPAKATAAEAAEVILRRRIVRVSAAAEVQAAVRLGVPARAEAAEVREAGRAVQVPAAAKASVPAAARVIAQVRAGVGVTSTVIRRAKVTVEVRETNTPPAQIAAMIARHSDRAKAPVIPVPRVSLSILPLLARKKKRPASPILRNIRIHRIHGQFNAMILIAARHRR